MKGTIALVVVLTLAGIAGAEDLRVNDESIVFLYESRAEIPAPDHYVAGRMSVDYRRAEDEFTRHELMQKIRPVMERRMREATAVTRVFLVVGSNLGDYDFDRNGFPTGMGEGIFVDFDDYYTVTFANARELGFIAVPMESARSLAGALRTGRRAAFTIYGTIVGAKEREINYYPRKTLELEVTRMEVELDSGRGHVGSKDIVAAGSGREHDAGVDEPETARSCQVSEDVCTDAFMGCAINCDRDDEACRINCRDEWRGCRSRVDC